MAEARLLEGIKRDLFCKEGFALFIKETTRLLAERNRQRRPDLERLQRRHAEVEQEIANIMTAIKQGGLTVSTKAELEKVEAEKGRLDAHIKGSMEKVGKVATMLPRAQERYQAFLKNLGTTVPKQHIVQGREQIRAPVGEIKLVPTTDGYLEAELVGDYVGLLKLAGGGGLNNVVAGERFSHYLPPPIRIALK